MDLHLLRQSVEYHGNELVDALGAEQGDHFISSLGDTVIGDVRENDVASKDSTVQGRRRKLVSFIAKKADMLFRNEYNVSLPVMNETDYKDFYGILPPLECYMNVSEESRKLHFYQSLSKGDIVVGSVFGKHTHGLIIHMLCLTAGKMLHIRDLHIKCFCNVVHIPSGSAHEDPLEAFELNDLVQDDGIWTKLWRIVPGVVLDVQPSTQKVYISMKDNMLPFGMQHKFKLGQITDDSLPLHYRQSLSLGSDSYGATLGRTLGFMNPCTVSHLSSMMGLDLEKKPSLMRGLHTKVYPKEDYASELYKVQCAKWAYKSVEQGVQYFKSGNNVEAFQCLNKALQIDPLNVEALVARGALYANTSSYSRAMEDFYRALDLNPKHSNAIKFSVETLIALGKQHEEQNEPEEAIRCYRKVLLLNPMHSEALEHMKATQLKAQDHERDKARQQTVADDGAGCSRNPKDVDAAADPTDTKEKLKRLLSDEKMGKHETRHKMKKNYATHSSSSESSSSYETRHNQKRIPKARYGSSDEGTTEDSSGSSRSPDVRCSHDSRASRRRSKDRHGSRARGERKSRQSEHRRRSSKRKYSKDRRSRSRVRRRRSRSRRKRSYSSECSARSTSERSSSNGGEGSRTMQQKRKESGSRDRSKPDEPELKSRASGLFGRQLSASGTDVKPVNVQDGVSRWNTDCSSFPVAASASIADSQVNRPVLEHAGVGEKGKQPEMAAVAAAAAAVGVKRSQGNGQQTLEELESFMAILKAKKGSKFGK